MNSYQNKKGQTKDFKADPLKQFLISRGTARDRAVDLCCAGKIPLEKIPELTDKLTILHFGQISVSSAVDAEILRIAARCAERERLKKEAETPMDNFAKEHPVGDDDHEGRPTDQEAAFDIEREWEQYERECAEEEANRVVEEDKEAEQQSKYKCYTCGKAYKTANGLDKHIAKEHPPEKGEDYGSHK